MSNNANIATLETSTVEFTNGETPTVSPTAHEKYNALDGANSAYSTALASNDKLASNAGQAINAFKAWSTSDKYSMLYIDRLVKECILDFAMQPAERSNAEPLTQAVKAMEHRGKKNYASKLKAFVRAVTNYKWNDKKDRFKNTTNKPIVTELTDETRAIMAQPFYSYVKPTKKVDFDLESAIRSAFVKADGKGYTQEERAAAVALFLSGNVPEIKKVRGTIVVKPPETVGSQTVDTEANESKAA